MTLQEYWNKKELSSADITFADGSTINLEENWCRQKYNILSRGRIEEDEIDNVNDSGTAFDVLGEVVHPITGHIAYKGEGSMGNEGFVAYADEHGTLFWLIFLDFSNPFWSIKFEGETIVATTELEFTFTIPLSAPEKLSCKAVHSWDLELIEECEMKKKRGYNEFEVLNKELELSIYPIKENHLKEYYPKLFDKEVSYYSRLSKIAKDKAFEIIDELVTRDGLLNVSFDEFKSIHQKEQTWIDDENMRKLFSQMMYYLSK